MAYEVESLKVKDAESNLLKDFMKRVDIYSSLGWKNRKGLDKSNIQGQVSAFAINFFSPKAIVHLKKYPEVYKELRSVNLIFQYIKYKPKESLRLYVQKELKRAKRRTTLTNIERRRKGLKPYKMPTRESLGLKEKSDNFKATYPKIKKRMRDGTIDYIKSDWTGYLVAFAPGDLKDGQSVGRDFFFKNPAIFFATTKEKITEKIYNKVKRILADIQTNTEILSFSIGEDIAFKKREIIQSAFALTPRGIEQELQRKKEMEAEEELAHLRQHEAEEILDLDMDAFNKELGL